jgi:outer membrane receptor for ferrienterochelin and colicin
LNGSDAIGGVINIIREKNETEGKTSGDVNTSYYSNTMATRQT